MAKASGPVRTPRQAKRRQEGETGLSRDIPQGFDEAFQLAQRLHAQFDRAEPLGSGKRPSC